MGCYKQRDRTQASSRIHVLGIAVKGVRIDLILHLFTAGHDTWKFNTVGQVGQAPSLSQQN